MSTRKRLHLFFRPRNALPQFYLHADHMITEGSERARPVPPAMWFGAARSPVLGETFVLVPIRKDDWFMEAVS